jgi:hypothetical protein
MGSKWHFAPEPYEAPFASANGTPPPVRATANANGIIIADRGRVRKFTILISGMMFTLSYLFRFADDCMSALLIFPTSKICRAPKCPNTSTACPAGRCRDGKRIKHGA